MPENTDSSKAWPYWMLRYMMQDDERSFEDLVWSVGGSPPYGGISYEEANAVFKLIEDFRGNGVASSARYKAVSKFTKGYPERERVLDMFHCYDEIVSAPDTYPMNVADRGLAIAESLDAPGAVGLFKLFQAGELAREGKNEQAAQLTLEALDALLSAAERDPACHHRVEQAAQNAVALTGLAGDKAKAAKLVDDLYEVLPAQAIQQLRRCISAQP